jgi:hypothetical protein
MEYNGSAVLAMTGKDCVAIARYVKRQMIKCRTASGWLMFKW